MSEFSTTDRRSFVKLGALAAAPVAAFVPAAALASDDTAARLARLEDERAIHALVRAWLADFNASDDDRRGGRSRRDDVAPITPDMKSMRADWERVELDFADAGHAELRVPVEVKRVIEHDGASTLEKMARFQGSPLTETRQQAHLAFTLVRDSDRWSHPSVRLTLD